ncbi:hypothetical protein QFC22_002356 [Naganishia vaughanmartiniae]|uniref:Uncharacterized protein n=1 Tax=Naganishia vaughanmartiniae TaxID=1424756 RepID=A0ACC2XCG5_9TREE|nr:hypothetical protein QFC22_002356 [Naganishia vaughanmartiniae]
MSASRDVAATLSNSSTSEATAVDALVEFIQARRKGGASLYDVTLQLMELLQRTPPALDATFDEARLATHLPPHTDLTPDLMARSLSRTISKAQVGAVLSQLPEAVTLGNAREVVLEWALGLEASKSTPEGKFGGKGTVSVTALEDIGAKFDELAEALGGGRRDRPNGVVPTINVNADALALLLSIRLSLGYLNEAQLLQQLETLPLSDGEAVLRHYVKRRLPAEGRYATGKGLEGLEIQADQRRPALKAVIRTVKRKYMLPEQAIYRIPHPPQNKSKCVSSIQSFVSSSASATSAGSYDNLDDAIAAYAFEILSEFCLKEKRDYMRNEKWIKSGRKGLSKDVNDIEDKVSGMFAGIGQRSGGSPLLPVFDVIRRLYNLEAATNSEIPSFSPITILDERVAYYPPTAQSVTSALYCHPRLETAKAVLVLIELVDYEKDLRLYAVQKTKRSMTSQDSPTGLVRRDSEDNMAELAWGSIEKRKMATVLESIERRFPEGDYREAFRQVAITTDCPPRALLDRAPSYTTVASNHTKSRTIEYLVGDVPGYQASSGNGRLPAHTSRPSIRTQFSSERWDQGRSPLAERMETLGVLEVSEHATELSPMATSTQPADRRSHARTGSLPGLWNTGNQYSPPRTNGTTNAQTSSPTPLYPADDATNRMVVNNSDEEDHSLTENQILDLYAGRSPVMVTPIERGPFTFGQNKVPSPATSPSSAKKQTSPRFDRARVEKSSAPPPSSSGGGLSSLFRKGSLFVRRGDQGESSRVKASLISPTEAGPVIRSVHPTIAVPVPTMSWTSDPPQSQSPENSAKKRTHTRQSASLEPTAWRQQFLNSGVVNMPRPAPKSASQSNLA